MQYLAPRPLQTNPKRSYFPSCSAKIPQFVFESIMGYLQVHIITPQTANCKTQHSHISIKFCINSPDIYHGISAIALTNGNMPTTIAITNKPLTTIFASSVVYVHVRPQMAPCFIPYSSASKPRTAIFPSSFAKVFMLRAHSAQQLYCMSQTVLRFEAYIS